MQHVAGKLKSLAQTDNVRQHDSLHLAVLACVYDGIYPDELPPAERR
jgi:hypothetical protein